MLKNNPDRCILSLSFYVKTYFRTNLSFGLLGLSGMVSLPLHSRSFFVCDTREKSRFEINRILLCKEYIYIKGERYHSAHGYPDAVTYPVVAALHAEGELTHAEFFQLLHHVHRLILLFGDLPPAALHILSTIARSVPHIGQFPVLRCQGIHDSFEHAPISYLYKNDDRLPFVYLYPSGAVQAFPFAHRIH